MLIEELSGGSLRYRAMELANNSRYNNIKVLEIALKILNERAHNNKDEVFMDIGEPPSTIDKIPDIKATVIKKHTKESAFALSLELGLSKSSYEELLKDLKYRGCPILLNWKTLTTAKEECKPKNYKISEVIYILHFTIFSHLCKPITF